MMDIQKALDLFVGCTIFDCHHCRKSFLQCDDREKFDKMKSVIVAALDKQTPQKAGLCAKLMEFRCVACQNSFYYGESNVPENFDFCPNCGQKLDWEDE